MSKMSQVNAMWTQRRQKVQPATTVAEVKLAALKGIVDNVELHRITESYKTASPEEKVAYYEGMFSSLWCITR